MNNTRAHVRRRWRGLWFALGVGVAMLATGSAHAEDVFSVDISNDTARLAYRTPVLAEGTYADVQYLHSTGRGDVVNGGFLLIGNAGQGYQVMRAGLGGQLYIVHPDLAPVLMDASHDVYSPRPGLSAVMAVGGFFSYQFPALRRLSMRAALYYGPSIITFGHLKRMLELDLRAAYKVIPNARVFLGYRQMKFDYGHHYRTLDAGLHLGVFLQF